MGTNTQKLQSDIKQANKENEQLKVQIAELEKMNSEYKNSLKEVKKILITKNGASVQMCLLVIFFFVCDVFCCMEQIQTTRLFFVLLKTKKIERRK